MEEGLFEETMYTELVVHHRRKSAPAEARAMESRQVQSPGPGVTGKSQVQCTLLGRSSAALVLLCHLPTSKPSMSASGQGCICS